MSEDKIIEVLNKVIQANRFDGIFTSIGIIIEAIQGLLDLYQKEKDLNQELQIRYKIENDKYKEEKEKQEKIQRLKNELKKLEGE